MKKFFMFLAVAGLMTFTANIASAQDEQAAPAATEQVAADEPVTDLFAGSGEEVPLHQALKTKFIEGGAGFMSLVLICLILGRPRHRENPVSLLLQDEHHQAPRQG